MSPVEVFGLPLHPLVVHAAVVLVPLAAIGAVLAVLWPAARERYGWLIAALAVAAAASALGARISGGDLLASMGGGTPAAQAHQRWGLLAPFPAIAVALGMPALMWLDRKRDAARLPRRLVGIALVAAAGVGLVLVALTGHSGATAVWAP